jgi:hypothetical protein
MAAGTPEPARFVYAALLAFTQGTHLSARAADGPAIEGLKSLSQIWLEDLQSSWYAVCLRSRSV